MNKNKTHCKHGHELNETNSKLYPYRGRIIRYCRICLKNIHKNYSNRHPERLKQRNRENKRKELFGLSQTEYLTRLEKQSGVCAICKQPDTSKRNGRFVNLGVDHNHACCAGKKSCGKCIRGLLCNKCNGGLGFFEDNISLLQAAITYLKERELILL